VNSNKFYKKFISAINATEEKFKHKKHYVF
jgi:hypothetical protein